MTISISWEWALGILATLVGSLITIAWKSSARFTALEVTLGWIKETVQGLKGDVGALKDDVGDLKGDVSALKDDVYDLKVNADNSASGAMAFSAHSPVNLTPLGEKWLEESGLKGYIDANPDKFRKTCEAKRDTNPYEIQMHIFRLFEDVAFESEFEDKLKNYAFEKGTTMNVIRRIGAIYLRNICLNDFGMKSEDIDRLDPEAKK